ncbi:MAG: tripartite tricarboxylate transporter substrate binding protein [Burkholderiales bacterium]|nr:tripartite tricarboxylate transporter substrate binding protein [Burkholderiales bacterium]
MGIESIRSAGARWLAALALAAVQAAALAQGGYPSHPVKLVVGAAPGGNVDINARIVAKRLGEILGQPVVVDNRPGAGGAVAFNFVRQAASDAHTLLMVPTGFTTGVALNPDAGYDPVKDFTPLSTVNTFAYAIAVGAHSPIGSLRELLEAARARPGTIGYGTGGVGSGQHLVGELLSANAGIQLLHVPYKGGTAPVTAVISGQIPMTVEIESVLAPQARGGKVRVLATTGPARTSLLPDVPTVSEAGIAGFVVQGWLGVVGPRGLAGDIVKRLNAALRQAVAEPEVAAAIAKGGAVARASSAEEFGALIDSDTRRWTRLVRDAGIRVK